MFAKKVFILFSLALASLPSTMLAAGGRGNSTPTPVITSAMVAAVAEEVTIRGYAFGTEAPLVMLGDQRLVVKQSNEKEIVAALPANILPATYSLLVIRSKNLQSPPFTLSVSN